MGVRRVDGGPALVGAGLAGSAEKRSNDVVGAGAGVKDRDLPSALAPNGGLGDLWPNTQSAS